MTFFLGVDVGQAKDYTAMVVDEYISEIDNLRHIQRFPLGTSYPAIVEKCVAVKRMLPGSVLVVDATGVGRAVVDLFWQAGLHPYAITITGGNKATTEAEKKVESARKQGVFMTPDLRDRLTWNVPKRDLVAAMQVALQTRTLKVASEIPDSQTFITEMLNFKVKIDTKTAHDSYEAWREGIHDDIVLAAAIAIYVARKRNPGGANNLANPGYGGDRIPEIYEQQRGRFGEPISGGNIPGLF
jgi:hypothetical protein